MAMEIYYDGECPFCSHYVGLLRLRENVGPVELIDARSGDPRVAELRAQGLDFDEGMAVRHGDRLYHGAEAVRILSVLSQKGGVMLALMRSPRRAALFYPLMRAMRNLTLRVMGRRPIG
ncbi:DUF393 domain-containing protein [Paracoccus caeni]|uniref:DUF393 domain-containing protein n=1 Tax=Paracoccus caeni TaxID=657651 RepID=A0A934SCD6_9RHOB|nr:DUF393 domain-containing protein [Paracoccus caeni]MBK4215138.1 DUF393 domain-containing protein [Paracoccus caeni]